MKTYDFQDYDMMDLLSRSWTQIHLRPGSITYDKTVFQENPKDAMFTRGSKSFDWLLSKHTSLVPNDFSKLDEKYDLI